MNNLKDIIYKIKDKNKNIDNIFNQILNMELNFNTSDIKLLYNIYNNLDIVESNINELHLFLLNKDPNLQLNNQMKEKLNDINIDNKILNMFLPYILLARMNFN